MEEMGKYARYSELYENPLFPGERAEDYLLVTSREWKQLAKNLLICALQAYDGDDIPDSIMVVVEDYFRAGFDAEDRERRRAGNGD